jgi:hypothetical protein
VYFFWPGKKGEVTPFTGDMYKGKHGVKSRYGRTRSALLGSPSKKWSPFEMRGQKMGNCTFKNTSKGLKTLVRLFAEDVE